MRLGKWTRIQVLALLAMLGCRSEGCCGEPVVCLNDLSPADFGDVDMGSPYQLPCSNSPPVVGNTMPPCSCQKDIGFSCYTNPQPGAVPTTEATFTFAQLFGTKQSSKKLLHVIVADVAVSCQSCLDVLCSAATALDKDSSLDDAVDLYFLTVNDKSSVAPLPAKMACYKDLRLKKYPSMCWDNYLASAVVERFFNYSSMNGGNSPISVLIRYSDMKIIYYADKRFQTDWVSTDGSKAANQYRTYLGYADQSTTCP